MQPKFLPTINMFYAVVVNLPEITSLGKWLERNLLSVKGVRIAAVFPSILPMPSVSSIMKYSTEYS